jgi:hypothetical protein
MRKVLLLLASLLLASPAWAQHTIDTLTAGGALTGTEKIPMFQTANPAVTTTPTAIGTYLVGTFLTKANNLSDVASAVTARSNLGLGTGNSPVFTGLTLSGLSNGCVQAASGVMTSTGTGCGSSGGGITILTGDGTTPSGGGSQPLTLATVNSNVGSFTNANITVNGKGLITAAANGSGGGGTPIDFTGVAGGTSTAYTVPTLTPSTGFANTAGFRVTASFTTANGANPTLSAGGLAAKPIVTQTGTGQSPIGLSVITNPSTHGFVLDASASNWIMDAPQTPEVTPVPIVGSCGSITAAMFASSQQFDINVASQTCTLPAANTISPGGSILIKTEGVTVTLTPQAADAIVINSLTPTVNVSVTLPSDSLTVVNTSGTTGVTAFTAQLGPLQYFPITWSAGQNLTQSSVNALPIGRFGVPRTIYSIKCMVNNAVGATAGFDIYATASGTAPASGTKINSTACNANTASNTEQDMGVASAQVPGLYWIYLVPTGTWTSSVGSGGAIVGFR